VLGSDLVNIVHSGVVMDDTHSSPGPRERLHLNARTGVSENLMHIGLSKCKLG
jgi:hypothetical protein